MAAKDNDITLLGKKFGVCLRELRKLKGLNQQELAAKADIASGYYGHFEQGRKIPSPKIIRKLAEILEYDYNDLMEIAGYGISEHSQKEQGHDQISDDSVEAPTTTIDVVEDQQHHDILAWAYDCIKKDPTFNFNERMGGLELPRATWLGFVEMYQGLTKRVLLTPEEINSMRNG